MTFDLGEAPRHVARLTWRTRRDSSGLLRPAIWPEIRSVKSAFRLTIGGWAAVGKAAGKEKPPKTGE